jgi:hypothetical protein
MDRLSRTSRYLEPAWRRLKKDGLPALRALAPASLPLLARRHPARSAGTAALGAVALGALALGAVALGALAVGRLTIRKARVKSLEVDELTVRSLRVFTTNNAGTTSTAGTTSAAGLARAVEHEPSRESTVGA